MFEAFDVGAWAHLTATRRWSQTSSESYDAIYRQYLQQGIDEGIVRAETDRRDAEALCEDFKKHFSQSPHVPSVLFLEGQAQDQRILRNKLEISHRIEYRNDIPNRASRYTWETIHEKFPEAPLAAMAAYKLSILEAQAGHLDKAVALLTTLLGRIDGASTTRPAFKGEGARAIVFAKPESSVALGVDRKLLLLQARRLHEMLSVCLADPPTDYGDVFGGGRGRRRSCPSCPASPLVR
jgi:hypothetical protein